jgi:hypothetical protein
VRCPGAAASRLRKSVDPQGGLADSFVILRAAQSAIVSLSSRSDSARSSGGIVATGSGGGGRRTGRGGRSRTKGRIRAGILVPALWRSPSPGRGQVGAGVEDVERGPLEALRVAHRTRHAGGDAMAGGLRRVVLADPPLAPADRTGRLGVSRPCADNSVRSWPAADFQVSRR